MSGQRNPHRPFAGSRIQRARQQWGWLLVFLWLALPGASEERIVFTQVEPRSGQSRLVLREPTGELRWLSKGFSSARDPAVSYDGQRILFAGQATPTDPWQIYELELATSQVRRLTHVPWDCFQPFYQSTVFVITADQPWKQIGFVGRKPGEPSALYSAMAGGGEPYRITYTYYGDSDPVMLPDGRVLFVSQQRHRLEKGLRQRAALFTCQVDGFDYSLYAGEQEACWRAQPCVHHSMGLVIFVESDRLGAPAGWLAAVSLRRPHHSYRQLTVPQQGLFAWPAPGSHGRLLVSHKPATGGRSFGIYRLDLETGRLDLVYDDPHSDELQARLVAPAPEPDGRSSAYNTKDPTGVLYCLNVLTSDVPREWLAPGSVKRLRVVEGLRAGPGPQPAGQPAGRLLGEIDLEDDGSFHIRVPANLPIQLQLVDEQGLAVRSCSWIWVRNREWRGCIGCHEDPELAPENQVAKAVVKPAVELTLPPEKRREVTFERDVAPVLRAKCSTPACHGARARPLLRTREDLQPYLGPAARLSPLVWSLLGRIAGRPWDEAPPGARVLQKMPPPGAPQLTGDELRTIFEWLDLGAR